MSGPKTFTGETTDTKAMREAFEAMREALQSAPLPSATTTKYVRPGADVPVLNTYERWFHVRCAALALADKVTK